MQLGDHLGIAGIILALLGIGITIMFPTQRPIAYLCFALAICGLIWWTFATFREKPKDSEDVRSYLVISLVIDHVDTKHVEFHFLLENKGPLEITVSELFYKNEWMIATEGTAAPVRRIIPGGKLAMNAGTLSEFSQGEFGVLATYTVAGMDSKPFVVNYGFQVRPIDLREGKTLEPFSRDEIVGKIQNAAPQVIVDGLRKSVGSITFWFPDMLSDGSPNELTISAGIRQIAFDPATRMVTLISGSNGKALKISRPLLTAKKGMHFVAATWDDAAGNVNLYVDGSNR